MLLYYKMNGRMINMEFISANKKKLTVFGSIALVVILIIFIPILSKVSTESSIKKQIVNYLTNECRLENVVVTLEKGAYIDYVATIECSNLDELSYFEMTSIPYYSKIDGVDIGRFICKGDTYLIYCNSVRLNGNEVYESDGSTHVTLKCKHAWSNWTQKEPCDLFEYITCTICGEQKDSRESEQRHKYDSNGYCKDCKEKVYYSEQEVKSIIQVLSYSIGQYDGEGLQDVKISWKNTSQKEIDKIIFSIEAHYSDEMDTVICESTTNLLPGEIGGKGKCWETDWPSGMYGAKITHISIFYTDGSKVLLDAKCAEYASWN